MTRTEQSGIESLDDRSAAFAAACVELVKRSRLRAAIVRVVIQLGLEPGPDGVLAVERQLRDQLFWSIDSEGSPVMASASGRDLDDCIGLYVQSEGLGLLPGPPKTEPAAS